MKTTFRYLAAAFTVIAAVSCAKHEELGPQEENQVSTYQYILNVSHENDDTKTTMDGVNILWNADDQIGVSCTYKYVNSNGEESTTYSYAKNSGEGHSILDAENYIPSTSATFVLNIPEGHTPKAIAYPYNPDMRATSGKDFPDGIVTHAVIPSTQIGIKGNIPAGAFAMVGEINKTGECTMRNVGALIKFEIKGTDVTSIKFEGNNSETIAGNNYYYVKTGLFAKEVEPETSVTLIPSESVFEPGEYYFAVSPANLSDGFTITLTSSTGQRAVRKSSKEFNIERNHKYLNFGSSEGWFKEVYTLNAGDLGSVDGSTATLYGTVTPDEVFAQDSYGFEVSADGKTWTAVNGEVTTRFSEIAHYSTPTKLNVFTTVLSNLVPEVTTYYRAYYRKENGITIYGKEKPFQTYAKSENVKIDLYNGWSEGYWPFTNLTYGTDIKSGTSSAALNPAKDLTFITSTGSFVAHANGGFWLNMYNGCLTLKPKSGNYIKFPIIEGKKPVSVIMVVGSVNGNDLGLPAIRHFSADGNSTVALGGGAWNNGAEALKYDSHTWNLSNTIDGQQYGIYFNSSNNCYISYLEVVYQEVVNDNTIIEQNLLFSDGTSTYWPFEGGDKKGAWEDYKGTDVIVGPFNTALHPNLVYNFHIASITGNNNWRVTAGRGLRFGGTAEDYMQICPVEGYKLTSIKIKCGNAATSFVVKDADGNPVTGGDSYKISASEEYTFTLSETLANTEYRLVLPTPDQSSIFEMTITYELVK